MKPRKFRYFLLFIMTVLTAGSLLLFPKININDDMTRYLPDDSRMKHGVDSLKQYFPGLDMNAYFVKVMFSDLVVKDVVSSSDSSVYDPSKVRGDELKAMKGVAGNTAVSQKDEYTMYQLSVEDGADPKAIAASISERYGDGAVVEHNANSIMPDNMVLILIIGVVIVFGILFLMCSSFVEALLFILTIGMAVILNMGTNAFLPSVSMMTNTIVAVLQLVLSMDYSIILMNRFRQVLSQSATCNQPAGASGSAVLPDLDIAMKTALRSASPSILSSSMTTIVGLLALVFMKFKIGLDLGLVLAKGVLFSLISIYTILPALILLFFKGIKKTEKRVFLIPTDRLASFENKARIPLTVAFIVVFCLFSYLSGKTELSYASIWESRINEVFPPKNNFSLLYRTSDEDAMVSMTDTISADPNVDMVISYPSIFKKKLTPQEMCGNIRMLLGMLPNLPGAEVTDVSVDPELLTPETLSILYYASSHPRRDEKMSFEDMINLATEVSKAGLLPEGMDVDAMMSGFMPDAASANVISGSEAASEPAAKAESRGSDPVSLEAVAEAKVNESDPVSPAQAASGGSVAGEPVAPELSEGRQKLRDLARPTVDESVEDPYQLKGKYAFTKDALNTPMNAIEMADYLGFSKGQSSAAYAMARKKNGTMTPYEFINYMINNVLGNKLLRKMISDKQAEGLYYIREEMDAVLAAPAAQNQSVASVPSVATDTPSVPESPESQSQLPAAAAAATSTAIAAVEKDTNPIPFPDCAPALAQRDKSVDIGDETESTPMDRLAEMYASGKKYSSIQIYRSLHSAGIDLVDKGAVDLMFTLYGSKHSNVDTLRMSLDELIDFISVEVSTNDAYSRFLDDSTRAVVGGLREMVDDGMRMIRGDEWSMAAVVTEYPLESDRTFDFVGRTLDSGTDVIGGDDYYFIGESVMYKEMKDGFRRELLFLTLLTVISIFVIVALTFKSMLIPIILVMTVLTGVFVNVFFSGVGGNTMLYLAYLIVQSILMGATIDYGILYTNYYLGCRREGLAVADALKSAYKGSIHTIMTSGLIIISAPFIMSQLLSDPTICSILSSLTFGALAVIVLILFVLPAILACCDKVLVRSGR